MTQKNARRNGNIVIFLMLSSTLLFGLVGLVFDLSIIYCAQSQLDASTQAAVLAGAEAMAQPGATSSTVTAAATSYSSVPGNKNVSGFFSGASIVSGYPSMVCLNTMKNSFGVQCYGPSGANAVVVKQQASMPLYFLRIFGTQSVTLTSTATAGMKGATAGPMNMVILMDSTASMSSTDDDSACNSTRFSCALTAVQILLKNLQPCPATQTTCGTVTSGNVANSVQRVSLLTFPPVTTATVANQYNCAGSAPTTAPYATPFPTTSTYRILNFSSDYRTSDTATTLASTSNLAAAVGARTGTPCMYAVGGYGTYYAQAIYKAQAYLTAAQSLYPNSQNVILLISDGDASATCTSSSGGVCTGGAMNGASTTSGTYPSTIQECHQAITAAHAAATAGTRVYSVAYGAAASGCSTDTSPAITPCQTMQQIASSSSYFFSDYNATGGSSSCISASQPAASLAQIFRVISGDLTSSKLLPNGTT